MGNLKEKRFVVTAGIVVTMVGGDLFSLLLLLTSEACFNKQSGAIVFSLVSFPSNILAPFNLGIAVVVLVPAGGGGPEVDDGFLWACFARPFNLASMVKSGGSRAEETRESSGSLLQGEKKKMDANCGI
jgi:hypothetical protein